MAIDTMEWIEEDGVWVSGPYAIELIEPRRWLLTRSVEPGDNRSVVRVDDLGIGGSLSQMKAMAEDIERRLVTRVSRGRWLGLLVLSVIVLAGAMGSSGRAAAVVAIVALVAALASIPRVMDGLERRPWDSIRGDYQ